MHPRTVGRLPNCENETTLNCSDIVVLVSLWWSVSLGRFVRPSIRLSVRNIFIKGGEMEYSQYRWLTCATNLRLWKVHKSVQTLVLPWINLMVPPSVLPSVKCLKSFRNAFVEQRIQILRYILESQYEGVSLSSLVKLAVPYIDMFGMLFCEWLECRSLLIFLMTFITLRGIVGRWASFILSI